jgi:hypothetical protein
MNLVPQSPTEMPRNGHVKGKPSRPSVLTPGEIRVYYRSVLGPERVPDSQLILLLPCVFKPHSDGMTINLRTGYWRCAGGCGEGDLYSFEMLRTRADHFRRSRQSVFEIVASASEPSGTSRIVEADVQKLVATVQKHSGCTRRYLQQGCHWSASRFNRAVKRIEQQGLVSWQDQPSTAGQIQRTYYPASSA